MALIFSIASLGRSRLAAGFNALETFSAAHAHNGTRSADTVGPGGKKTVFIYIDAARIKVSRTEGCKSSLKYRQKTRSKEKRALYAPFFRSGEQEQRPLSQNGRRDPPRSGEPDGRPCRAKRQPVLSQEARCPSTAGTRARGSGSGWPTYQRPPRSGRSAH